MVWLKADSGLANTYKKLINASRADVDWQGEILVQNNTIILPGSINSFIFDFELKRVYPNIIDIPQIQEEVFKTEGRKLLANIFNLLVYIFGKWGVLPGIRVPHSYARIDLLLKQILKEINSESYYSDSGIKFTSNGLSVVFEDIIVAAINKIKADESAESEEESEQDNEEGPQGLWHDMKWRALRESFNKQKLDNKKATAGRLGSNFYMTPYICPGCGNHLHMSVYPDGKEFVIDTEEGRVYMARVYMCPDCCRFYTPRPDKLLSDSEVYILDFDNDEKATEDYKKLIGKKGRKTSNSNFNMYETEYMDRMHNKSRSLSKICSRIKELEDEDLERLLEQMDEGFFSDYEIERFLAYIEQELEYRRNLRQKYSLYDEEEEILQNNDSGSILDKYNAQEEILQKEITQEHSTQEQITEKIQEENNIMDEIVRSYMSGTSSTETINNKEIYRNTKSSDKKTVNRDYSISKEINNIETASNKIAGDGIKAEDYNNDRDVENYKYKGKNKDENKNKKNGNENKDKSGTISKNSNINKKTLADTNSAVESKSVFPNKEVEIKEIKASQTKKSSDIQKLEQDVKNSSLSSEDKEELDYLVSHIPQNDSKERYKRIKERIKTYNKIDTSKYEEIIDKFIQNAEHAELSAMVRRVGTSDRHNILELIESLKNADFDPGILKEYNDELYRRVREIDTETVRRICPDIYALDVEEGMQVMREIESADILQELKSEMITLIDKRLTRMKTEESEQLVEKLKRVLDRNIEDSSRIHYYDARKMQEGDNTDSESILIRNAISKYAVLLGKYEYPIIICDSSLLANGKDGFIITPDHIFYKSMLKSGQLDVLDIEDISQGNGKAMFINKKSGNKVKLPCPLKSKDLKSMTLALNDFITYLKAKPESRKIEYMTQKKHSTICCYRCGHVFKGDNICPKCGGRN